MIVFSKKTLNLGFSVILISVLLIIFSQNIYAKGNESEYMGRRMMGSGMMGSGMMGMCSPGSLENVKTNINETRDGFTVTYTAKDKKDIARLQKIAKINKLSQEINEEEAENK